MRATSVLRSRDGAPELPGLPVESLPHSAAICASVWKTNARGPTVSPWRVCSNATARMINSECPPKSRKLSCVSTWAMPSNSHQTSAIARSAVVDGACAWRGAVGVSAGAIAGRACRSTLPLGVVGIRSTTIQCDGTM